ncbi:MAG: tyrosine recombinase [Thermomicrobiales bacterium]
MIDDQVLQQEIERFLTSLGRERQFSENTIAAYRNDLSQFRDYVKSPPSEDQLSPVQQWTELTSDHLNRYLNYLRMRDYAASTVARKTAALKTFSQYLEQSGQLRSDPSIALSPPRVDRYVPRAISVEEVERLMAEPRDAASEGSPESYRDLAMLETLYSSGMRVSELVALDLEDIDLERMQVRCPGKGGRSRIVPLRKQACEALQVYIDQGRRRFAGGDQTALFVNHRGGRLTRQGFWLILKSYADKAGISDITPHTLRHSFAAHAIRGGAELRDVQQLLGHVSISTTQVYRRLAEESDRSAKSGSMNGVPREHVGTSQ